MKTHSYITIISLMLVLFGFNNAKALSVINKCTTPAVGSLYYSDGSCSVDYISGKNIIGVIYYVFPNGKNNIFNVVNIDQYTTPLNSYQGSAIRYCNSYSKHGISGWRLPNIREQLLLGREYPQAVDNKKITILNGSLQKVCNAIGGAWGTCTLSEGGNNRYANTTEWGDSGIYFFSHLDNGRLYTANNINNASLRVHCILSF